MSTVYKISWAALEQAAQARAPGYLAAIEELGTVQRDEAGAPQYALLPDYYYDAIKAKYSTASNNSAHENEPIPNLQQWFKILPDNNPLP
jgi:hypothetical protein